MPIAKGKGGSTSHRYRPASEYDDATLAQKREYWRTKKREQRARLSEQRGKPTQDSRGKKTLDPSDPTVVNSTLSNSSHLQSNGELYKTANVSSPSQSGGTVWEDSVEDTESQKERWLEMKLDKVLPQLALSSSTCSISAKTAVCKTAMAKCLTRAAVSKVITSSTPSRIPTNTISSVPPVTVTRIINGSSTKTTPKPHVSMQGASIPKMQQKEQVAFCISPTNVNTSMILMSSPCASISIKTEGKGENTSPQYGKKCALVISQRVKNARKSQLLLESEEERAARRREHWRIKKREQRAKVAARLAKAREKTQSMELMSQRPTGCLGVQHLSSQSCLRRGGLNRSRPRNKISFMSAKREGLAPGNLQEEQVKVKNPHAKSTTQTLISSDVISSKKPGETLRKPTDYVHLSRGIARCKTTRQKFSEAQRNLLNQRNTRCKTQLLASVFGARNIPIIDAKDTPEQVIAKQREYWRVKKREQRAKLSLEVKARLKEKDSLMRRMKRYQKILEEMRRARVLTQSVGSALPHVSEPIGGFIKEDGTVTINVPQDTSYHSTAAQTSGEEPRAVCDNSSISKPEHQPDTKQKSISPFHVNQHTPPLCPSQVKVSLPLSTQCDNKSQRLMSIRTKSQLDRTTVPDSHSSTVQTVGQLTLTHPQTARNGGPVTGLSLGGCVMKMAVSNSASTVSSLELTEEERMARKRDYWRIKKREQRAARAARLKNGLQQTRTSGSLQRQKEQMQVAVLTAPQGRRLISPTQNAQHLPKNIGPIAPNANEIKEESEPVPAVDLNSLPGQTICSEIKLPTSPTPPLVPQSEPDAALNADNQATTLLAVASMKKLLEESLSSVMEHESEQSDVKIETVEEASEPYAKPDLTAILFEKDELAPVNTDFKLEIKSNQPDTNGGVQANSTSPHLKNTPQKNVTVTPFPSSSEVTLNPVIGHSSQNPSNFKEDCMDPTLGTYSSNKVQRLCTRKIDHQHCASPQPPKLHCLDEHCEQKYQAPERCQNNNLASAKNDCCVRTKHSSLTSLQKKREYWKLMKRQQRARLKARKSERLGECSSRISHTNTQAPGVGAVIAVKGVKRSPKPPLHPKPSVVSVTAVSRIPTILVVSPTTCNAEQSSDTLQVRLPITSVSCSPIGEQGKTNIGTSQIGSNYLGEESMPGQQIWTSTSTDIESYPCPPPLEPPDNPLSSINMQPIEPSGQTSESTLSPIKIPCAQFQSPRQMVQLHTNVAPISNLVPPKAVQGESEEDFLRRKREYWRIKKKEQRARKAIWEKGITPKKASSNWRPTLPAQDIPAAQDSCQWVSTSEESEHLLSSSLDTDLGSFPYTTYGTPVQESELLFADYENNIGEEGPVSDNAWRNHYLMDYDPLNQLLVCMVCGELQYSHSLEGVRVHIDEAHPDTLTLDPKEKQRILEAWDEQVIQRERFFTSQLQQHGGAMAETHNRGRVN